MKLDKFSNPIFNETDIFNAMYEGNIELLPELMVENTDELNKFKIYTELEFIQQPSIDQSIDQYDKSQQETWFMPDEYYTFDIKDFCISKCITNEEKQRVEEEYEAYELHNMIKVLQWMKYFVDTCNNNEIFWGVGRGSSVSSYILYLIGVHRINSIKYNLDWKEFLR